MHELGRFIQSLMDQEGMTQPDLVRRSGLSRQHVHTMLKAETLTRLPAATTIDGLHQAFPHVTRETFVLRAAAAMGIPVDATLAEPDYSQLSNDTLLGILRSRLDGGSSDGRQPDAEKMTPPRPLGEEFAQLDGVPELTRPVTRMTPKHERMLRDAQEMDTAAYDGEDPEGGR